MDVEADSEVTERRSQRKRKQRETYSPDRQKTDGEKRKVAKSYVNRAYDVLPNGQPFSCFMCKSPYVVNLKTKVAKKTHRSRHIPLPQTRTDKTSGEQILLCNACVAIYDRPARKPSKYLTYPSEVETKEYLQEAEEFAKSLRKDWDDPLVEKLFCPVSQMKLCGCLQKYLKSTLSSGDKTVVPKLLELMTLATELRKEKCYAGETSRIGLGNGHKKSKRFEQFVMTERRALREDFGLCERATQKILMYSNNFLHKRLKTDSRVCRIERTRGKAVLGKLPEFHKMIEQHCCSDNCVMMALTHKRLLQDWRARAQQGQAEARRVMAEMLTPAGATHLNCYVFISMVTGCSPGTIARVNNHVYDTGGLREPPEHGMKKYWKKQFENSQITVQGKEGGHSLETVPRESVAGLSKDIAQKKGAIQFLMEKLQQNNLKTVSAKQHHDLQQQLQQQQLKQQQQQQQLHQQQLKQQQQQEQLHQQQLKQQQQQLQEQQQQLKQQQQQQLHQQQLKQQQQQEQQQQQQLLQQQQQQLLQQEQQQNQYLQLQKLHHFQNESHEQGKHQQPQHQQQHHQQQQQHQQQQSLQQLQQVLLQQQLQQQLLQPLTKHVENNQHKQHQQQQQQCVQQQQHSVSQSTLENLSQQQHGNPTTAKILTQTMLQSTQQMSAFQAPKSMSVNQSVIAQQLSAPPLNSNLYQSIKLPNPPVYTGNQSNDAKTRNQSAHAQSPLPVKIKDCTLPSNIQHLVPSSQFVHGSLPIISTKPNLPESAPMINQQVFTSQMPIGQMPNNVEMSPQVNTDPVPVLLVPNMEGSKIPFQGLGSMPTFQLMTNQGTSNIVPANSPAMTVQENPPTFTETVNGQAVNSEPGPQPQNMLPTAVPVFYMIEKPTQEMLTPHQQPGGFTSVMNDPTSMIPMNQTNHITVNPTSSVNQTSAPVIELTGRIVENNQTNERVFIPTVMENQRMNPAIDPSAIQLNASAVVQSTNQSSVTLSIVPSVEAPTQGNNPTNISCSLVPVETTPVPVESTPVPVQINQQEDRTGNRQEGFPTQLHITYQTNSQEAGQPMLQQFVLPHGDVITLNLNQLSSSQIPTEAANVKDKQISPNEPHQAPVAMMPKLPASQENTSEDQLQYVADSSKSEPTVNQNLPQRILSPDISHPSTNLKTVQRKEREIRPNPDITKLSQKTRFLSGSNIKKSKLARSTGARSITPHTGLRVTFEDNADPEMRNTLSDSFQGINWESKLKSRHFSGNSDFGGRSRKSSGNSLFSDFSYQSVFPFSNLSSPNIFHDKDRGIFFIQSLEGVDLGEIEPSPTWEDMYQSAIPDHMNHHDNTLDNNNHHSNNIHSNDVLSIQQNNDIHNSDHHDNDSHSSNHHGNNSQSSNHHGNNSHSNNHHGNSLHSNSPHKLLSNQQEEESVKLGHSKLGPSSEVHNSNSSTSLSGPSSSTENSSGSDVIPTITLTTKIAEFVNRGRQPKTRMKAVKSDTNEQGNDKGKPKRKSNVT